MTSWQRNWSAMESNTTTLPKAFLLKVPDPCPSSNTTQALGSRSLYRRLVGNILGCTLGIMMERLEIPESEIPLSTPIHTTPDQIVTSKAHSRARLPPCVLLLSSVLPLPFLCLTFLLSLSSLGPPSSSLFFLASSFLSSFCPPFGLLSSSLRPLEAASQYGLGSPK